MTNIEPARTGMFFRPTNIVFGRVMEELDSFNAAGLIDRSVFYTYVKETLHNLGAAIYREDSAILDIVNSNHKLPDNFCVFWAAYKCRNSPDYQRLKGFDPRQDITLFTTLGSNPYPYTDNSTLAPSKCWNYSIECPSQMDLMSKIAVRYYIRGGQEHCFNFTEPCLMGFDTMPEGTYCDSHSPCYRSGSPDRIKIDNDKFLWTSFPKGIVYMQYWGMPVDKETGLPLIPDNPNIEKAIEFYIEYRLLRKWYINNKVGDLERKLVYLKAESDDAFSTASTETKTPAFQTMMRTAKAQKNRLGIYQLNDHNYYHAG